MLPIEEEYAETWGWFLVVRKLMDWRKETEFQILRNKTDEMLVEIRMMRQEANVQRAIAEKQKEDAKRNSKVK